MKTIMHPDYWVEIPAGEFLIGISPAQEQLIAERMKKQFKSNYFPYWKKRLMESAPWVKFDQQVIYLEKFYIMRFQVSNAQVAAFHNNRTGNIPGSLEGADTIKSHQGNSEYSGHTISKVTDRLAEAFCKTLAARLPTKLEWEKAARGTEGRLYPWGDDWNVDAGYFFHDNFSTAQEARKMQRIDAYPKGVSPFGIYGMVGYLPQLTGEFPRLGAQGGNASESSAERAWIDFMIPFIHNRGDYSSLRLVLDKWPRQQWQGHDEEKGNKKSRV